MDKVLKNSDIGACPLDEIDAFDPHLLENPHVYYSRLRQEAPVYRDPNTGVVYISTDAFIREANLNPTIFSNAFEDVLDSVRADLISDEEMAIRAEGHETGNTMLTADPPRHTRYKKLGLKGFSYKRVLQMGEYIAEVANRLIDDFIDEGRCDFRKQFADKLPMYVIIDMLGAEREDFDQFKRWSEAYVSMLGGVADSDARINAARRVNEFQGFFLQKIAEKRESPSDDILSDLVHADLAEEGDSRKMDDNELLSFCSQILVAGNESTANQLTDGMYQLISHPKQMRLLREQPNLMENFVEESLRLLTPSNNMWRVVTKDYEFHGVALKAGDKVLVRYGSGNRDEARYNCPHQFDIERENAKDHLSFGHGIHTCLGAQLARKELVVAFSALLTRMNSIRLAPDQAGISYSPSILLRGPIELHIEFDKA